MFIHQTGNTMETHIKKFFAFIGAIVIALGSSYAQNKEYDDMYFTPNDRTKVKKVKVEDKVVQDANQVQQLNPDPQESYSSKTVNPEYLARYQAKTQEDYNSDSEYAEEEYFDENYQNEGQVTSSFANNANYAVRDRYGNTSYYNDYNDVYWSDPAYFRGTAFDPFYRPYYGSAFGYRPMRSGWSVSVGFGNTWGWRNGWYSGVSVGYGWGWGSGFYDPFYDPFYGYAYDPFYCPPYARYGYGGFYGNSYRNVVVINNYESRNTRTINRGTGMSRSGNVANNNRGGRGNTIDNSGSVTNGRSSTVGRTGSEPTNGRASVSPTNTRDYSDTQSRYYRRSREAVSTSSSEPTQTRTYNSRSSSTSNYSTESRSSSRSSSTYSRPSNNNGSRSNSTYNDSRSNSGNSRSYSTPSRSNSSGYSSGSNSRSNNRSSGYSSGSGSSSRSSGSSYSSGSSSRSSGSSSRSSSGSSRSSSSSRRGGN